MSWTTVSSKVVIFKLRMPCSYAYVNDACTQVYPLPAVAAGPSAPYAIITGGSSGIGREIANEVNHAHCQ